MQEVAQSINQKLQNSSHQNTSHINTAVTFEFINFSNNIFTTIE
jgi:hypothetical protein